VEVGLHEVHHRVALDRRVRPTLLAQELVEAVLVVALDDLRPALVAALRDHPPGLGDRLLPHLVGGAATLLLGHGEGQQAAVTAGILERHPLAADMHQAPRVAHHELGHREVEQTAVLEREVVRARDAHAACLRV
jgi:hypothetical protein